VFEANRRVRPPQILWFRWMWVEFQLQIVGGLMALNGAE
jgi:hypothetical protein